MQTIDTRYSIHTPEGVALRLTPAGPVLRFYAWFIDSAIRLAVMTGLIITLSFLENLGNGLLLILFFFIEWFYPVYFELFHNGKTPGKSMMGLFVAQENASPITPASSLIRNLLRFVDFLPFAYGFGLVCVLSNQRFQRIGDIVAGTVVLHVEAIQTLTEQENIKAEAPPRPLQLQEQQAIINFYQRRATLSEERAEELANITGSLVDNKVSAADFVSGMGRWIMGKR